ncbi:hypothetical protein BSKO_11492 [Bryopsis sp. KO-2023]|nr:hypothetical protein BSKO_11492 [Bryopsis sp. KO-2023]
MKCAIVLCVLLAGCALAQCQKSDLEEGLDKSAKGTFPPPTPADPPALTPDPDSPSGREYIIGGASGWTIKPYEDIDDAQVGDSLVFKWIGSHTVWQLSEKECVFQQGTGNEVASSTSEAAAGGHDHDDSELAESDNSLGFNPPTFMEFKQKGIEELGGTECGLILMEGRQRRQSYHCGVSLDDRIMRRDRKSLRGSLGRSLVEDWVTVDRRSSRIEGGPLHSGCLPLALIVQGCNWFEKDLASCVPDANAICMEACWRECGNDVFYFGSDWAEVTLADIKLFEGLRYETPASRNLSAVDWNFVGPSAARESKPQCKICRGCQHDISNMDVSVSFLDNNFTHRIGRSDAWVFRVPLDTCDVDEKSAESESKNALVKVWCLPYKHRLVPQGAWWEMWRKLWGSTDHNKIHTLEAGPKYQECKEQEDKAVHEANVGLSVTKIAQECGLSHLLPEMWVDRLHGIMPETGYPIDWHALWMTEAKGIAVDNIAYWNSDPHLIQKAFGRINSEQVVSAAIFDLLTLQCDRHTNNIFMDEAGNLTLIDNGDALGNRGNCQNGVSLSSIFIPGTPQYAHKTYGKPFLDTGLPFLKMWHPLPHIMLDYRCHADGGQIGRSYPPQVNQCLQKFSQMDKLELQRYLDIPDLSMAATLKRRSTDMLEQGFEWTLKNGEPKNSDAQSYAIDKPCCQMSAKRHGISMLPLKYQCVSDVGVDPKERLLIL